MGRQRFRAPQYGGESVRQFLKGFHSDATKEAYSRKLFQFAESCGMTPDGLLAEANRDPKPLQRLIVDYIERRKSEVSGSTINITVSALKHFFEMNDAEQSVNWAKVSRLVPKARRSGSDRAPTTEEIRQMVQAADIRTRCVILTCASSGITSDGRLSVDLSWLTSHTYLGQVEVLGSVSSSNAIVKPKRSSWPFWRRLGCRREQNTTNLEKLRVADPPWPNVPIV